jgi:hypothetical protein
MSLIVKTIPPPFVCDSIRSRCGRGILLCDPKRVDQFFKGDARGRDLSDDFFASETKNVFTEGIAVPFFDPGCEDCKVTARSVHSQSKLLGNSLKSFPGWILGTKTGELVLCSMDALLFWDPYENDEFPQRYLPLFGS